MTEEVHNNGPVTVYSAGDLAKEAKAAVKSKAREEGQRARFAGYELRVRNNHPAVLVAKGVFSGGREFQTYIVI